MSRKATIDHLFTQRGDKPSGGSAAASPDRVKTGAISAMGSSLKQMAEGAKAASQLREQIAAGGVVIEIDPDAVEASPVADRIAADIDPAFDALVESLRTSGQQVPILVRPAGEGRYQIVYGRRRLRAAARLGVKIKALVRPLSDVELVIAQGKENLERKDLSYIERAQFARALEAQGFERSVIMSALATDKADLSRYLSIAKAVPDKIIRAIGPAPKTGRPRWAALAPLLKTGAAKAEAAIARKEFKTLDSDARFAAVFDALSPPAQTPAPAWALDKAVRIERRTGRTIITVDEARVSEFGAYLVDRLDALYRQFQREKEAGGKL